MKITKMDRNAARVISQEAQDALQRVVQKYGLTLKVEGGRFDPYAGTFSPKITFGVVSEDGADADERQFKQYASLYGLKPEHFGCTFYSRGTAYKVVGLAMSRSKYPVRGQSMGGKVMLFTADAVARQLMTKEG